MGALVMDRQGRAPTTDAALARAAIEGDGQAFAQLYDRHERRAFNLCYRITGSREDAADATQDAFLKVMQRLPAMGDRDLDFGNYLLTAARHASYDVMTRAGRAEPRDEIPDSAAHVGAAGAPPPEEDPERRQLLEAQQEEIRAAHAELPVRQREALALYELGELSYDEIAEELDMNRNSVAQLISRARVNLRDGLRRTALSSILPGSPQCERALPLIAMRDDRQLDAGSDDGIWLREHLADCETCRLGAEAMAEAGTSYRAWALVPAVEVLRRETIAKAAEMLGHDWSAAADSPRALGSTAGGAGGAGAGAFAGATGAGATGGLARRLARDLAVAAGIGAIILGGILAVRTADHHASPTGAQDAGLVGVTPGATDSQPAGDGKPGRARKGRRTTSGVTTGAGNGLLGTPLAGAAGTAGEQTSGTTKPGPRVTTKRPGGTANPGGTVNPGGAGNPAGSDTSGGTSDPAPTGNPQGGTPDPTPADPPSRGGSDSSSTGNGSSSTGSTQIPGAGGSIPGVPGGGTQTDSNNTSTDSSSSSTDGGSSPTGGKTPCSPRTRGCVG